MSARAKRAIMMGVDGLQLPQVQRFVKEGFLPNFERLLKVASAGELLPELPAWTPTNWGTIATGAFPGSTLLAGFHRRANDDLGGENTLSTFSRLACPVETIWEAAGRAGLWSLCINYPLSWPPRSKQTMVVAPVYRGPGVAAIGTVEGGIWTTKPQRIEGSSPIAAVRWQEDRLVADVEIAPPSDNDVCDLDLDKQARPIQAESGRLEAIALRLVFGPTEARVEVLDAEGRHLCQAGRGQWSDWVRLDFGGELDWTVRFYLFSCQEDGEYGCTLAHSSLYPTRGFTFPPELAGELLEYVGPFPAWPITLPDPEGGQVWVQEIEDQGLWIAGAARYLLETRGWDLYYQHYHTVDHATHHWLNGADPEGGGYDPQKADFYQDMMRKAYEVTDRQLGQFLEMMDDQTVLMVVSDHGNVPNKWMVDYDRMLEETGFLVRDGQGNIVWEETRAFMIPERVTDIYINLKGKYPKGTVDPADREKVQEEIIDMLLDLRNPDGKRVVALALKKKDAQMVRYYGEEVGDVVFTMNSFHGRGNLPEGVVVQRDTVGANHGTQVATTRTEFSSDLATAIVAGPGIRKGYVRDAEMQGLWQLVDVVPTIAYLLDFPPPSHSRGGIMYDLFG